MKIFWSWQSDTPGKTGRFFVRDALLAAIEELRVPPDIEEPDRNELREALHLDSDRQGVPGSPDLAATILEKIEAAGVVIADVTPVGQVSAQVRDNEQEIAPAKKLMNPNVAIELGYAIRAVTDRKVLMVCNAHYGDREDLPFDLRHKAGPIIYNLAPDADRLTIDAAKKLLKGAFVQALRPFLEYAQRATEDRFVETPTTFSRAVYFNPTEVLASVGEPDIDQVDFGFDAERLCYLRLIPTQRLSGPLPLAKLNVAVPYAPLLTRGMSTALVATNRFGAIRYEPGINSPGGNGRIIDAVQLFRNGEVWAISSSLIIAKRDARPTNIPIPLIPLYPFEQGYHRCLTDVLGFMSTRLGLAGPWKVELGAVGLAGVHYSANNNFLGPLHENEIAHTTIVNEASEGAIEGVLLPFFEQVFDLSGDSRPSNLHGFPAVRQSTAQASAVRDDAMPKTVGILAFGSLIGDPGNEIGPHITKRIASRTPFKVEFARASESRDGAPTLVPYVNGSQVDAEILIVNLEVEDATDRLYRREIHEVSSNKIYEEPPAGNQNSVRVCSLFNFEGVGTVLYAEIGANIDQPTASELARLAIKSARARDDGKDGITYLRDALANNVRTPLSDTYLRKTLDLTGGRDLDDALAIVRLLPDEG
jgi:hypothetical protein